MIGYAISGPVPIEHYLVVVTVGVAAVLLLPLALAVDWIAARCRAPGRT